jgi:hypothetical protein
MVLQEDPTTDALRQRVFIAGDRYAGIRGRVTVGR